MSILLSWTKLAADIQPPMTTAVPEHLQLGSDNSSIGSRMRDTGSPLPVPPVNGVGAVLGKVVGLPSYQGMYSPQQFKIPQYGSADVLQNNIAAADKYRQKAKLPPLNYQGIFDRVPLYRGAMANSMGGFVPFSEAQKTSPVFLGSEPITKAIDSSSGSKAWFSGINSTREQQQAAMLGKPKPGGLLNKLMERAQSGGDLNSWKEYGALARSSGVDPTPENAGRILANTTNRSISGGNPNDTLHDQERVLEHELGHTWLKDPTKDIAYDTPARKIEDGVGAGLGNVYGQWRSSGNVSPPWYSSLKSLQQHDANLPEFLNYGSALQGHMHRTTGKRLETPEAVRQWTDDLLGSPDEPTFEQRLQPYPFDVRRMMRHNWRLQQGQGNDAKKELLENLKQRMQTWFPALVNNSSEASKVASLSRFLPWLSRAAKPAQGLGSTPRFREMMKVRRDLPVFSYASAGKEPDLRLLTRRRVAGKPVADTPDFKLFPWQDARMRDAKTYLASNKPEGFYSSSPWSQYVAVSRGRDGRIAGTTLRHELTHFYQHKLRPQTWMQRQVNKGFQESGSPVLDGTRDLALETGARLSQFRGHPLLTSLRGLGAMALEAPAYAADKLMQGDLRRALPFAAASAPFVIGLNGLVNRVMPPIADTVSGWMDPHPSRNVVNMSPPPAPPPPPPDVWQRAQQGIQDVQAKAPQVWGDTKKFLTGINPFGKKSSALSRLLPAATKAVKFMARVPSNQPFAPTLGKGVRNAVRVGFNPYLGKRMQLPKRLLQGATLWGLGSGVNNARNQISDIGGQADSMIPDLPQTSAVKSYAQQLHDSPLWTTARTAIVGLPSDIPPTQRDFLSQLGALGVKSKLYGTSMPASWKDYATTVYKPAMGATTSLLQKLLQHFVPPAGPKDYLNLAGSAYKMVQPPG